MGVVFATLGCLEAYGVVENTAGIQGGLHRFRRQKIQNTFVGFFLPRVSSLFFWLILFLTF